MIKTNAGHVMVPTSNGMIPEYSYAVSEGYSGTEDEYVQDMAKLPVEIDKINSSLGGYENITSQCVALNDANIGAIRVAIIGRLHVIYFYIKPGIASGDACQLPFPVTGNVYCSAIQDGNGLSSHHICEACVLTDGTIKFYDANTSFYYVGFFVA